MRMPRNRMYDDSYDGRIKLTPEQEELREQIAKEDEERWRLEEQDQEQQRVQGIVNLVTGALDIIKEHPLVKQIFEARLISPLARYAEAALPSVIAANPQMDHTDIAKECVLIARSLQAEIRVVEFPEHTAMSVR